MLRRTKRRRRARAGRTAAAPSPLEGLKDAVLEAAKRALERAESDPQAFRLEARAAARRLGVTIEEVYRAVRVDPNVTKNTIGDIFIKYAARALKREMGR